MQHLPLWIEYVKALGPSFLAVVAAVIAGAIAYRQWKTAQNKLKLDLFDRRYEVYDAAATVCYWLSRSHHGVDLEPVVATTPKFNAAGFLFDPTLEDYFLDIRDRSHRNLELRRGVPEATYAGPAGADQLLRLESQLEEARKWFDAQLLVLAQRVRPFLQLNH